MSDPKSPCKEKKSGIELPIINASVPAHASSDDPNANNDGPSHTIDLSTSTDSPIISPIRLPIHQAVATRNLQELRNLLANGAATNVADPRGWTPLNAAIVNEWRDGVKELLDSGVDITMRSPKQLLPTVLHLAASIKGSDILELLLTHSDAKLMVNVKNRNDVTPLFEAISNKNEGAVKLLLNAGADVTLSGEETVLHRAVMTNQLNIVNDLFNLNIAGMETIKDKTWSKSMGMKCATALHLAAHAGHLDIVDVLLKKDCNKLAKMEFYGNRGFTALHLAVYLNHIDVVDLLLKSDPSLVAEVSEDGLTPIHIAIAFGFKQYAHLLLFAKSDLSALFGCADGKSVTNMGILLSRMSIFSDFLKRSFDLSITSQKETGSLGRCIDVNYAILSPLGSDGYQQLRVIDSLLQAGEHLNQHLLFLHPLVESYLHRQWEAMSCYYWLLLISYIMFTGALSGHIIGLYRLQGTYPHSYWIYFWRSLASFISVVIWYEFTLMLLALYKVCECYHSCQFNTFKRIGLFIVSMLKLVWVFILIYLFYDVPKSINNWFRDLATLSLILFWLRLMHLMSNVPHYGCYLLMFFEVALNFFKVLLAFSGIIGVFVAAFCIEFGPTQSSFNSTWNGIVKTIVMMSSEFEYTDLFEDLDTTTDSEHFYSVLFRRFLFVMFIFLVAVVIMNILIAKAIIDVKKFDQIRKQAEFLIQFEKVIGLNHRVWSLAENIKIRILSSCGCTTTSSAKQNVVTINIGEDWKYGALFPKDLHSGLWEIALQNNRDEVSKQNETTTDCIS